MTSPLLALRRILSASFGVLVALSFYCPVLRAAEPVTIVAFGDSTTAPRGGLTVFPSILQSELLNVQVVNAGVPGNTTEQARNRFKKDVLDRKPGVVIVLFGINDSAIDLWRTPPASEPRVKLERYVENLKYFITSLKESGSQVVLVGASPLLWTPQLKKMYGKPPYDPESADGFNVLLKKYNAAAAALASESQIPFVDLDSLFREHVVKSKGKLADLIPDGMHPNDEGHRVMADAIRQRILELAPVKDGALAIRSGPVWTASGATVMLAPGVTDISIEAPEERVLLGCGLAPLPDGSIAAVYSTPSSYYAKAGQTWIAMRVTKDGGKTWSEEKEIARNADCQASHPSILRTKDGTLHVFYLAFKGWKWKDLNPTDEAQSDVYATRSTDGGETWSTPQPIFDGYSGATNGAIETRDGKILVPYSHYVNHPGRLVSRVSISSDGGKTWKLSPAIDIGGAGDHEGALEPSLLELKTGQVWMLIRTTRGKFWNTYSMDGGATWSTPSGGQIDATSAPGHMARLADGRIALVYNIKAKGRRELYLSMSADDGDTWSKPQAIARGKSVTYPFVIEAAPGELWIGYHDVPKGWNFPRARHVKMQAPK